MGWVTRNEGRRGMSAGGMGVVGTGGEGRGGCWCAGRRLANR